jgi:mono/diheme cytochrome c family protein
VHICLAGLLLQIPDRLWQTETGNSRLAAGIARRRHEYKERLMTDSIKQLVVAALGGLLMFSGTVLAEDFDRGQALYENHCLSCHEATVHTRDTRRATSVVELRKWVATWNFHASLGWSGEEIDDVADYMNRRYYHFTAAP